MAALNDWIVPLLLTVAAALTLRRGEDPYAALAAGAGDGLRLLPRIFTALVALLTAAGMLRASGFFQILERLLAPLLARLGLSAELLPLLLLQPISGSGSLALAGELMARHGGDSDMGRTAAALLGSSETAFYTVAVYFGAAGIRDSRHALPAALIGYAAGAATAIVAVRWML